MAGTGTRHKITKEDIEIGEGTVEQRTRLGTFTRQKVDFAESKKGIRDWQPTLMYDKNAITIHQNILYKSLTSNAGNVPKLSKSSWQPVANEHSLSDFYGDTESFSDAITNIKNFVTETAAPVVVRIPPGTFEVTSTIVLIENMFLVGAGAGLTTLKAERNFNSDLVLTNNFATLKQSGEYIDVTENFGLLNVTLDGNKANNNPTNVTRSLGVYGRNYILDGVSITDSPSVSLDLSLKNTKTQSKSNIFNTSWHVDNITINDSKEESFIYDVIDEFPIGSIFIKNCGDLANDGTTPQTSRLYPSRTVNASTVTTNSRFSCNLLSVDNSKFGNGLFADSNCKISINELILNDGWGNADFSSGVIGQIDKIHSIGNPYSWSSTAKPHVKNDSSFMVITKLTVERDAADSKDYTLYDTGGGVYTSIIDESTASRAGNGIYLGTNPCSITNLLIANLNGTPSIGTRSQAITITANARHDIRGNIIFCDAGVVNSVNNLSCKFDLYIQSNNSLSQKSISGIASQSGADTVEVISNVIMNAKYVRKSNIIIELEPARNISYFNNHVGSVTFDATSTANQNFTVALDMWRTPILGEFNYNISLTRAAGTLPSLDYFYTTSVTGNSLSFSFKLNSALTATNTNDKINFSVN